MAVRLNVPDIAFAAFLVALGAFAFALSGELTVGTAAAMGPGYVPRGSAAHHELWLVLGARGVRGRQAFPGSRGVRCADFGPVAFSPLLPRGPCGRGRDLRGGAATTYGCENAALTWARGFAVVCSSPCWGCHSDLAAVADGHMDPSPISYRLRGRARRQPGLLPDRR